MLITAFIGNGRLAKDFLGPALQLDASHRLGHALGANRVRTAWEGETLLRLRHAAARHGCREQGQDDEAASPDWLLNLLHVQLSRRLAVSAAMALHSGTGTRAEIASSGAIPALCLGSWPPGCIEPSACRRAGAAMRKFRADKGIGETDLRPDSPMVYGSRA